MRICTTILNSAWILKFLDVLYCKSFCCALQPKIKSPCTIILGLEIFQNFKGVLEPLYPNIRSTVSLFVQLAFPTITLYCKIPRFSYLTLYLSFETYYFRKFRLPKLRKLRLPKLRKLLFLSKRALVRPISSLLRTQVFAN